MLSYCQTLSIRSNGPMRRLGVLAACLCTSLSSGEVRAEHGAQGLGPRALAAVPAPRAPAEAGDPVPAPLWTFHSGAPLRAPAGLGEGGIAVGSADGYVHALRPDGAYRWSFTVKGAVIAQPLVDARGGVYVATSRRQLHALTPRGTLGFSVTLAGVALDPVRWSQAGELLIATREGTAYAITRSGVVRAAAALREPLTAAPLPLRSGGWLVGGSAGRVFTFDGRRVSRHRPVRGPVLRLVPQADGYVGLGSEGVFTAAGATGVAAAELGCGPERVIVVAADGAVGTWRGQAAEWFATIETPPSAAPACARDGRAFVPTVTGTLAVVAPAGPVRRYALGSAALFTPLVDEAGGQLIVSAADGQTTALPLETL